MISEMERGWAEVVLSSFAGSERGFTVPAAEVDYTGALEKFLRTASQKARLGVRVALLLTMMAPVLVGRGLSSLRRLAPEARGEVLDRMSRHRFFFVRELCLLLKLIACMAIFRFPGARERAGFDRPQVTRLRVLAPEAA